MKFRRLYIDMDGVMANFVKAFDEQFIKGKLEYPQCQARFFENLEPMPLAIESVSLLCKEYDVWVLTAPSVENVLCYTEKVVWVKEHFPAEDLHKRVVITPDKTQVGDELDALIDDLHWWAFKGELIQFGTHDYPDWTAIVDYLL